MAEKDGKTEKPTPKKLRDARKKGQVPKSQDLSSALSFGIFALAFTGLATYVFQRAFVFLRNMLKNGFDIQNIHNELGNIGIKCYLILSNFICTILSYCFSDSYIWKFSTSRFYAYRRTAQTKSEKVKSSIGV